MTDTSRQSNGASKRLCVVGAGLCGLTAAQTAQDAGWQVTVIDKGRGVGGRMATRRSRQGPVFDHGAQFFTARSPGFQDLISRAAAAGAVSAWTPQQAGDAGQSSDIWYVGTPGMTGLAAWMAAGLHVQTGQTVCDLARQDMRWRVSTQEGGVAGVFDRIVLAIPPVQALALLSGLEETDPALDRLSRVEIDPCWSVLIAADCPLGDWPDVVKCKTGPVSWIARNASKPGRTADHETLVVHMSAEWSKANLEEPSERIERRVLEIVQEQMGGTLKDPVYMAAHRWRYAKTAVPLGDPLLKLYGGEVLIGGDWCLGARVEAAFQSGQAMGYELAGALRSTRFPA